MALRLSPMCACRLISLAELHLAPFKTISHPNGILVHYFICLCASSFVSPKGQLNGALCLPVAKPMQHLLTGQAPELINLINAFGSGVAMCRS